MSKAATSATWPPGGCPSARPRFWDAAVDAWPADDADALDRTWDELIPELGSDYDAYSNVSSIGWAA
ncbi:hypothetical protein [Streptomyces rimosus]|uniref:hypothetical protein n=1 Tax=Streptomyces rimosus TaxID=1927 RepID=UPI0037CDFAC0